MHSYSGMGTIAAVVALTATLSSLTFLLLATLAEQSPRHSMQSDLRTVLALLATLYVHFKL